MWLLSGAAIVGFGEKDKQAEEIVPTCDEFRDNSHWDSEVDTSPYHRSVFNEQLFF